MRIIRRTFANLSQDILLLGKAGENLVTKLEIDISKELKEFQNPSFELILKTPASDEPYPVLIDVADGKLTYSFTGSDLAKSGDGELEALVSSQSGELLKSTTAKTKINPSIIQNTYPGPLQKVIDYIYSLIDEIDIEGKLATKEWVKAYFSPFTMGENGHLFINTESGVVEIDDRGHAIITIQEETA